MNKWRKFLEGKPTPDQYVQRPVTTRAEIQNVAVKKVAHAPRIKKQSLLIVDADISAV